MYNEGNYCYDLNKTTNWALDCLEKTKNITFAWRGIFKVKGKSHFVLKEEMEIIPNVWISTPLSDTRPFNLMLLNRARLVLLSHRDIIL